MDHPPATCTIDQCPECATATNCGHADATNLTHDGFSLCAECYADWHLDVMASADAAFGYTPGEDLSPTQTRILENEAFLPDHEVRALLGFASCEAEAEYDTPSLQDTDPEGHRYITNDDHYGY
jgi:hypothetical protein